MLTMCEAARDPSVQTIQAAWCFSRLSSTALWDLESMVFSSVCPAGQILFSEGQSAPKVFIILTGEVKLSMTSSDGRTLALQIARAGEVIGLVSVLSGRPAEWTAETRRPTKIATIDRSKFLGFLALHPELYEILAVELSRGLTIACGKLRSVGLHSSAAEKLAHLLLDWSEKGQKTGGGTRFLFPLTHREIGELIGTTRETVTRIMGAFKHRRVLACHGAALTIPNRIALERYARRLQWSGTRGPGPVSCFQDGSSIRQLRKHAASA